MTGQQTCSRSNLPAPFVSKKSMRQLIGLFIALGIAAFFINSLSRQWSEIKYLITPQLLINGILTIPFLLVMSALNTQCLRRLLAASGVSTGFRLSYRLYYLPQLGKYVPGKLWGYIIMWRVGKAAGVASLHLLESTLLLQIMTMVASVFVGSVLLLPFFSQWRVYLVAASVLSFGFLMLGHPIAVACGRIARKTMKSTAAVTLNYRIYLSAVVYHMISHGVYILAVVVLLRGFGGLSVSSCVGVVGAFAIAWLVGVCSFVTPGGLGVREAALLVILRQMLSPELALVIPIVLRGWLTAGEALCGVVALILPPPPTVGREANVSYDSES